MRYALEQFPSVTESDCQALAALGVTDTDQLLDRAAMPSARENLARRSQIPLERWTRFAGLADLVRVKGIGTTLAEIILDAGAAGNVQQLVERSKDLPALRQTLVDYTLQHGIRTRIPSLSQLGEICAEARELRPRLLLQTLRPDPQFRRDLFSKAWKERKASLKLSLGMFAAVLLPIGLLWGFAHFLTGNRPQEFLSPYEDINRIYQSIEQIRLDLLDKSLITIIVILVGLLFVLILAYDVINFLQATWLVLILFPTPGQKEFYQAINALKLEKEVRVLWLVVAMLATMALILAGMIMNVFINSPGVDDSVLIERFSRVIIPGGILIGIITSFPILTFLRGLTKRREFDQGHIQRYFVHYMFKIMMLPVMVVLFTQIILPFAVSLHSQIVVDRLAPQARFAILEKRQELANLPSDDIEKQAWRDYVLSDVDTWILPEIEAQALIVTPDDSSMLEIIVPAALNMVVWLALVAFLLLFVAPYLMLGGWGRGLFYMFILGISSVLDDKLTMIAPTWFRLPQGSLTQGPFIAFFILINALFFDWFFEVVTTRKKICPACKTELEKKVLFCSTCGYQQE